VEEKIVRLFVEEKTIIRILRSLEEKYDNEKFADPRNMRYSRSILEDDHIWLN